MFNDFLGSLCSLQVEKYRFRGMGKKKAAWHLVRKGFQTAGEPLTCW